MAFTYLTQMLSELLNQFEDKQQMINLFTALVQRFDDTRSMLDRLYIERIIDDATGVWLDDIGRIVGMERLYVQLDPSDVFTYRLRTDTNDPSKGYSGQGIPKTGGRYGSIHGLFTDTPVSDTIHRGWIKWKIDVRNKIESIPTIYEFIDDRFGYHSVISVPQVGRVRVEVPIASSTSERFLMKRYMPLAAGIELELLATLP
jgi:hypothetical protein